MPLVRSNLTPRLEQPHSFCHSPSVGHPCGWVDLGHQTRCAKQPPVGSLSTHRTHTNEAARSPREHAQATTQNGEKKGKERAHFFNRRRSRVCVWCGFWFVASGLWFVVCSLCFVGLWFVVCGLWFVVCGLSFVVRRMWFVVCGLVVLCGCSSSVRRWLEQPKIKITPPRIIKTETPCCAFDKIVFKNYLYKC